MPNYKAITLMQSKPPENNLRDQYSTHISLHKWNLDSSLSAQFSPCQ